MSRKKAIEKVHKEKDQNTLLVTQYHPNLPSLSRIIRKHWEVMTKEAPKLKKVFPKPSVVAYKRTQNLKDLLVRAKVSSKRRSSRKQCGFFRCGR